MNKNKLDKIIAEETAKVLNEAAYKPYLKGLYVQWNGNLEYIKDVEELASKDMITFSNGKAVMSDKLKAAKAKVYYWPKGVDKPIEVGSWDKEDKIPQGLKASKQSAKASQPKPTSKAEYLKILKGAMRDARGMGDEEHTYDMATSMIHDPAIKSYLNKNYPYANPSKKLQQLQWDLEMFVEAKKQLGTTINEAFTQKSFPVGTLINFKDGEVWKVVKPKQGTKSNEITIKPHNDKAKKQNVSLEINVDMDYLNKTVKNLTKESVNEAFTAVKKDTGKVSVFKSKEARDAAIKAGTHEKHKVEKDTTSKDTSKDVNIFEPEGDTPTDTQFKLEQPPKDAKQYSEPQVAAQLDKLAAMAKQAKEKGEEAPDFDLCQVSIPGTNLFCSGNKGIPRKEMPQLKGKPAPNTPAAKIAAKTGEESVDGEKYFVQALKKMGVKMTPKKVNADTLKSTQSQLVGTKVAGMAKALEQDPKHPAITAPIFVSKDGYVLDGHHRWAAQVGAGIMRDEPVRMNVIQVDMPIEQLVDYSNKFADKFGIAQKAGKVKEGISDFMLNKIINEEVDAFVQNLTEGKWAKIMKAVRQNPQGPFSVVAIKDKKVVGQSINIKIPDLIPAHYEEMKRKYPGARISIENGEGTQVYFEGVNEDLGAVGGMSIPEIAGSLFAMYVMIKLAFATNADIQGAIAYGKSLLKKIPFIGPKLVEKDFVKGLDAMFKNTSDMKQVEKYLTTNPKLKTIIEKIKGGNTGAWKDLYGELKRMDHKAYTKSLPSIQKFYQSIKPGKK